MGTFPKTFKHPLGRRNARKRISVENRSASMKRIQLSVPKGTLFLCCAQRGWSRAPFRAP
jgi:hypothetical protein